MEHNIMSEIQIRKLTVADCRKLVAMLRSLAAKAQGAWIKTLIKPVPATAQVEPEDEELDAEGVERMARLFLGLLDMLLEEFEGDVTEWFASLCGVSVEEYLRLPIDTDLIVIEQIKSAEEFPAFFERACAVLKLQGRFGGLAKSVKNLFASTTDSTAQG
jgi:hypothetical protein